MSRARQILSGDGYAHETITVANTAIGFTAATWRVGEHSGVRAVITATGGQMRYRYDGGNPTTTVGHLLAHGDILVVENAINIVQFRVIQIGTQNGTLSVTYERIL